MQEVHQDAVIKLEAQISAAHEATAGKQAEIQVLDSSIAELRNKQTELQDQASSLEVTIGTFTVGSGCRLTVHFSLDLNAHRELLLKSFDDIHKVVSIHSRNGLMEDQA